MSTEPSEPQPTAPDTEHLAATPTLPSPSPRRREPGPRLCARSAELEQAEADLKDFALVLTRDLTDSGERTSIDDVLATFGHSRASLEGLPGE